MTSFTIISLFQNLQGSYESIKLLITLSITSFSTNLGIDMRADSLSRS